MTAALFTHWDEEVDVPTLGPERCLQVVVGGSTVVERAVILETDPVAQGVQTGVFKAPEDSPGLAALASGGYPLRGCFSPSVEFLLDGQRIFDGYVDEPEIDFVDGWGTYTAHARNGDIDRAVLGDTHVNLLEGSSSGNGYTGWLAVNATLVGTSDSAGTGGGMVVRARLTDDDGRDSRANPYRSIHRNANVGVGSSPRTFFTSAYLKVHNGTKYKQTVKARSVVWPLGVSTTEAWKRKIVLEWSLPDDLPGEEWIFCQGPEIEVPAGWVGQIRTSLYAPMGGDSVIWSEVQLVADEKVGVGDGGEAASLVALLFNTGAASTGAGFAAAAVSSSTQSFTHGQWYPTRNHDDVMGLIRGFDASVDWYYDAPRATLYVGGLDGVGDVHDDVSLTNFSSSPNQVSRLVAPASGLFNDVLVASAVGDGTRSEYRTGQSGGYRRWTKFETAPDDTLPSGLGGFADAELSALLEPGLAYTVRMGPPPGGRCGADWLIDGPSWARLKPFDSIPTRVVWGPYDVSGNLKFTRLAADLVSGTLQAEVRS